MLQNVFNLFKENTFDLGRQHLKKSFSHVIQFILEFFLFVLQIELSNRKNKQDSRAAINCSFEVVSKCQWIVVKTTSNAIFKNPFAKLGNIVKPVLFCTKISILCEWVVKNKQIVLNNLPKRNFTTLNVSIDKQKLN